MQPRQTFHPVHCYPTTSQGTAWELINNVGMSPEMACTSLISTMAAALHGLYDVEPLPGMRIPLSLITFTVAPSGSGKTVVQNRLTAGFKEFEDEMREKFDADWIDYQSAIDTHSAERKALLSLLKEQTKAGKDSEYVRQQLSDLDKSSPPMPKLAKVMLQDTTETGIQNSLFSNWPNAFFPLDEAARFLENRFPELIGTANSTWSGSPITVDTAKRKIFIKHPRITWNIQVQPKAFDRFMKKLGPRAIDEGLWARTLIAHVEPTLRQPVTFANQQWASTDRFNEECRQFLLASVGENGKPVGQTALKFDAQAQELLIQERQRINLMKASGGTLYNHQELCAKAADNIARIAAIIHVFDKCEGDISSHSLAKAIEIFAWFANEQIRVLTPTPQPPQELCDAHLLLQWLANYVRTHNLLGVQKNHLLKFGPRAIRAAPRLNAALIILWQQGWLEEKLSEGSKAVYIVLNPNAFQPHQIAQLLSQNLLFPQ